MKMMKVWKAKRHEVTKSTLMDTGVCRICSQKDRLCLSLNLGLPSTTNSARALIALLANHPEIQTRMQREIDEKIGEAEPRLKDKDQLPYTIAVRSNLIDGRWHDKCLFLAGSVLHKRFSFAPQFVLVWQQSINFIYVALDTFSSVGLG